MSRVRLIIVLSTFVNACMQSLQSQLWNYNIPSNCCRTHISRQQPTAANSTLHAILTHAHLPIPRQYGYMAMEYMRHEDDGPFLDEPCGTMLTQSEHINRTVWRSGEVEKRHGTFAQGEHKKTRVLRSQEVKKRNGTFARK